MNIRKEQTMYTIMLITGIFVLFGGVALVKILSFDNLVSIVSGIGGGWIGISISKLYQIKKQPEKYKQELISQSDERSTAIRGYAAYSTLIMTICVMAIASLISLILSYHLAFIIVVALLFILIISFFAFMKYYSNRL